MGTTDVDGDECVVTLQLKLSGDAIVLSGSGIEKTWGKRAVDKEIPTKQN